MLASDVKVGNYVRPKQPVPGDPLYEVEGRTPGGKVQLRDCRVDLTAHMGIEGLHEGSVLDVVRDFELVTPDPDPLERLVA